MPGCDANTVVFCLFEFCELRGAWGGGALQDIDSKETPLYIHPPATPRATASAPPQQNRRGDSLPVTVHTEVTRNNRPLARMHPHSLPHPASHHPPTQPHASDRQMARRHQESHQTPAFRRSSTPSTHAPIHPSTHPPSQPCLSLGLNEVSQRDTCGRAT